MPGGADILEFDTRAAWSPDGSQLAVIANIGRMYKVDVEKAVPTDVYVLTVGRKSSGAGYERLSGPTRVAVATHGGSCLYGWTQLPSWSPDGNWIAFERDQCGNWEVLAVNPKEPAPDSSKNHNIKNVTSRTGSAPHDGASAWSPSGKRMLFVGYTPTYDERELRVFDASSSGFSNQRLFLDFGSGEEMPAWSRRWRF